MSPEKLAIKKVTPLKPAADNRMDDILKVATSVFAAHGYRNTDVQVIADELGIGKATIYRKFPTKQDLFFAAVDRGMERLYEYLDNTVDESLPALERLKSAIRQWFTFFKKNSDLVELFFQERAEFRHRPQMTYFKHRERHMCRGQALFQEMVTAGVIRNLPVDTVLDVLSQTMYGALFVHFLSKPSKSLEQRAEDIIEVFVCGLLEIDSAS